MSLIPLLSYSNIISICHFTYVIQSTTSLLSFLTACSYLSHPTMRKTSYQNSFSHSPSAHQPNSYICTLYNLTHIDSTQHSANLSLYICYPIHDFPPELPYSLFVPEPSYAEENFISEHFSHSPSAHQPNSYICTLYYLTHINSTQHCKSSHMQQLTHQNHTYICHTQ